MVEKFLRSLYYSLFFAVPLLMFPLTSELFEFNKILFIYLAGAVGGAAFLLNSIRNDKFAIKKNILNWTILGFLIAQVLATLTSIDRHTSLVGYYGRFNGGLLSIITYTALFFIFINTFRSDFIEKLLKVSVLSSTLVILWGLPGKWGYDMSCFLFLGQWNNSCWTEQFRPAERMFSTLGQPNWLGAFLAINFFLGLYFFLKKNKLWPYGVYLLLSWAGILFTRSRSAYMALGIGIIIFLVVLAKNNIKKLKFIGLGFLILILIFKTGINSIDKYISINSNNQIPSSKQIQNSKFKIQNSSSTDVTESGNIRKIVWKGAVDLGKNYPLFGTGVETFAYSYYFVRPKEHNLTSEWDFLYNKAHNEYLNYLATTGFVGLGAYLIMIGTVIYLFLKNLKKNHQTPNTLLITCLFCAYLTILITNFFGFSTTTVNLFFYLIPAFLLILNNQETRAEIVHRVGGTVWLKNSLMVIVVGLAVYALFFLINYFRGDLIYAEAESFDRTSDYVTAVSKYQNALNIHYEHVYQDKLSSALSNLALLALSPTAADSAKRLIDGAEAYNIASIKASPNNVLYWKTRAKNQYIFYQLTEDKSYLKEAEEALSITKKLAPTDPKIFYTSAVIYSQLYDSAESQDEKQKFQELALADATQTIELKADYSDGYLLRAELFRKFGREEDAEKDLRHVEELKQR